ncbi:tail fiber protein [Escherichia coli O19:H7]|nr:tail fiber protein [Escherichia coli O19:H7]
MCNCFSKNLRLGAGAPAIGIPFFWPSAAMPNTVMDEWANMVFLKPNGASFSAAEYPKLAKVWTGLVIPDMRGEFLRVWDDGRGVDSGRALLSAQIDTLQNITAALGDVTTGPNNIATGAFGASVLTDNLQQLPPTGNYKQTNYTFDASRVARTSTETRSRNIAFNFLVRAK